MTHPLSTYRLQFHRGFTFDDARAQIDYFARLGVSHLYASPITTSQPGSTHGYDTVDYTQVDPELGGETGLRALADALHRRGMGLIIDIVPNHMGVGGAHNRWWLDLLEAGSHSPYASFFDIEWHSPEPSLQNRLLVPFLGAPYGEALASGDLSLQFDAEEGALFAAYFSHRFPIRVDDYAPILERIPGLESGSHADLEALRASLAAEREVKPDQTVNDGVARRQSGKRALAEFTAKAANRALVEQALASFDPRSASGRENLHALLERQHYRLAWWRTAADEINWRRFFDISALAGMRQEDEAVFEASHALILRLYAEGVIDGVRVDHVDGLAQPREYCQRLRARLREARAGRTQDSAAAADGEAYLVVEKILARGEALREDWGIDGTTGYDFMNDVGALLHDPSGAPVLAEAWARLSGRPAAFHPEAVAARRKMLAENLRAELERCARSLHAVALAGIDTRDYSLHAIRRVLAELVVHYPIYRIYPRAARRSAEDEAYFAQAREAARAALGRADHALLEHIDLWLGAAASHLPAATEATLALREAALALFSQLTSPVAAKAVEDTGCYRYGRLLSRNEVGADPDDFAMSVEQFHAANQGRAQSFPRAMLTTATHDHKRGEDVRARIAALSEIAEIWSATVTRWSAMNAPHRRRGEDASLALSHGAGDEAAQAWAPGPGFEAMLYQTLVGCWPNELSIDDEDGVRQLAERVAQWQEKALREAKLETDWFLPNASYEEGSRAFLFDILSPRRRDGFLRELRDFAARLAPVGAINSLQQTVLRLASPGIPDLYQGTELWDETLVDPDNRRPVDYGRRAAWLDQEPPSSHLAHWQDARVKLAVIHRALRLRQRQPGLFIGGRYEPLRVSGPRAKAVIAFARHDGEHRVVVIATRLSADLLGLDQALDERPGRNQDHAGDASRAPGLPLVPASSWRDTVVHLPDLPGQASAPLWDWFSDRETSPADGSIRLETALARMPVALLSDLRPLDDR